jgi:DNA-binding beta-propeller fold protein YncE
VDGSGNLYVVDRLNHRVQKFDSEGVYLTEWGSFGSGVGEFNDATPIAVDADGEVFVGDLGRIQVFTSEGVYVRHWLLSLGGDSAEGLAFDSQGRLYVASQIQNRVLVFSQDGALLDFWGLVHAAEVAVDGDDNVYVSELERIKKFSNAGVLLLEWGTRGKGDGEFYDCYGLAVDFDGLVYASDRGQARNQVFTSGGEYLTQWGTFGAEDGQFWGPVGIAMGPDGAIYLADRGLNRVQKFAYPTALEPMSWGKIKAGYRE